MMKKVLSLILAIAMTLTLIPAAFAAEGDEAAASENFTILYSFKGSVYGVSKDEDGKQPHDLINYENSGEKLAWVESTYTNGAGVAPDNPSAWNGGYANITTKNGAYVAFKINVPKAGAYAVKYEHLDRSKSSSKTPQTDVYIIPYAEDISAALSAATALFRTTKVTDTTGSGTELIVDTGSFTAAQAGEHLLVIKATNTSYIRPAKLTLTMQGEGDAIMGKTKATLKVGETMQIKGYKSSVAAATAFDDLSYASNNNSVAKVDENGLVTAMAAGTATITTTSASGAYPLTTTITVEDAETDFVTIAIDDDGDGYATVMSDVALGSKVEAVADVPENMVFRGWVRGSAENGRLVSTETPYEFTAMTNIYLTAIYTPVNATATDEYYHWNGQFLGNTEPTTVSPIVGYTFAETWTKAKEENSITSWIANFNKKTDDYSVTAGNDGFSISKADSKYDTEVTCTSDNGAVYWYRDNKLVDYGTEYKFFIWDNTTVTTSKEGHNGAKLMLDKKKDNTYMVEYDAGDKTLLEVGILFGKSDSTPTVEVCEEKMSSQRNEAHGQFSATAEDYTVVRGYLIYKDGDTYRVIYAD